MKDELRNIISGKNKVRIGATIQAVANYLRRGPKTGGVAKNEKHFKKQETTILKEYVNKNNLWVANIDISNYVSEGAEQKVYLKDAKYVLKLNDSIFYNSWEDYFNNLLLHNFYFADTAYELIGFIEEQEVLLCSRKAILCKSYP